MEKLTINIIANGVWGPEGLSGGDNIFINFSKILAKKGYEINIFTWEDGLELCKNNGLENVPFFLWSARRFKFLGFFGLYVFRTLKGCIEALKIEKTDGRDQIIYSASDFWPDSLPAFLMSRRLKAKWVAGFYLFAPDPFLGFRREFKFRNLIYWLSQKPIFWLISKYANMICVTSDPDLAPFVKTGRKTQDLFVVKGGIDYYHLQKFQKPTQKIYDGVFVGRFHPQKGVVEMIDVWHEVVKEIPEARLAVIGVGSMEKKMKNMVERYKLEKNTHFLGALIGDEKNKILQKSKVFLHPVIYDSGGMAPADGLACGLPVVSFDLPVFKTYYPHGFLHAKEGDIKGFAQKIIILLKDKKLYEKMKKEAIFEAKEWDWEKRVYIFHKKIQSL